MANSDQKTTIMDLPPELFERVGEMVSPTDLCAMRLVSKQVKHNITRLFTNTYFSTITLLLSNDESLQRGIEIAAHPSFGPAVQTIKLYVDDLPDREVIEELVEREESWGFGDGKGLNQLLELVKVYEGMKDNQERMHTEGVYVQQMVRMMRHLKRWGKVNKLEICDHIIADQEPNPIRALQKYAVFGLRTRETLEQSWEHYVSHQRDFLLKPPSVYDYQYLGTILEALALSGLELPTLTRSDRLEDGLSIMNSSILLAQLLNSNDKLLHNFQAVIANLQTLKLSLWLYDDMPAPDKLVRIFNHATKLKDLELEILNPKCIRNGISNFGPGITSSGFEIEIDDLNTSRIVKSLLQQSTIPKLEVLNIVGATIEFSDLTAFVKRHSSLKEIRATWCELRKVTAYETSLEGNHEKWEPLTIEEILEGTPLEQKLSELLGGVKVGYVKIPNSDGEE